MGCRCADLRAAAAFLAVDLQSGAVQAIPETLDPALRRRVADAVRARWLADPGNRIAYFTAPPGEVLGEAAFLAFNASLEAGREEGRGRAVYVLLAPLESLEEYFSRMYLSAPLLPEAVAQSRPNDSLLYLAVHTPQGQPVFLSPRDAPGALAAHQKLGAEQGNLEVAATIRSQAASSLVIGGLPRSRLPLLLALMLMTVGVGMGALLQIRKEEELARLREDFISGVSHEFRTPLTQIRMFSELMADGKLRTDEEWTRATAVINREARRLTHLVENLLHFSRLGRAPAQECRPEALGVSEAIRDLTEAFSPLAEARRTSIEVLVDPPEALVRASRGGLYQMLANLLDNALKYGPEGQTVKVEARVREGRVLIAVEDQGPGIPVRERERVWDPYHRLQREVDRRETGSGIGLSLVQGLARASGGRAWVEDGRGGGARFLLDLPASGADREEGAHDAQERPPRGGEA
jgi:signal transduction histidine kinase